MDTRIINSISGRLSLRAPQRESLEALAKAIDTTNDKLLDPKHDVPSLLKTLKAEFPTLEDFERDFPSLCFALATGVGKTRLMGAFISYLHLAHGIKNFFVLAPNLTIYEKLIADFSPGTPKYVFKGIAEFAAYPPEVITGDNYEQRGAQVMSDLFSNVRINVFNISKINSEVRGGKAPRIKRLSEYLGDSYFSHLAGLPDLVLLMDESHRYRASAGVRALNELNPILGLELTATPQVEIGSTTIPFKNVVVDYPLARAMEDGFVKEPAVVTQRNFDPNQYSREDLEEIKLKDGIRLHEATKVELITYAHENDTRIVKPFMLVIARDTTHAKVLKEKLEIVFDGKYAGKVIQVDSSSKEEETVQALLNVESSDEPTEIVIHVNMLKEGWDVTNLYTIVPLRAANAKTLVEQTIGRGLRLPYGKRTGVEMVDRLSIVAHDRFQEIVDEANKDDSVLRKLKFIELDYEEEQGKENFQIGSNIDAQIFGGDTQGSAGTTYKPTAQEKPLFASEPEKKAASAALTVIKQYQSKPEQAPTSQALQSEALQQQIIAAVKEHLTQGQQSLLEDEEQIDIADVVAKTTALVVDNTIDIPRIIVTPKGTVTSGYHAFTLDISGIKGLKPQERSLVSQSLQTNEQTEIGEGDSGNYEPIKENYILKKLFDYDDIPYDEHAELMYDLAKQAVECLSAVNDEKNVENILQNQSDAIARLIHAQMDKHFYEEATEYEVEVRSGFTTLKVCSYTAAQGQDVKNYRDTVTEVSKIKQILFGGFKKCLYPIQKFDSDTERRFAIILERDAIKWFKPAKGQFKMYYKKGTEHPEYVPDFIVETNDSILMVETKSAQHKNADGNWNEEVTEKAKSGVKWCANASTYLKDNGGKEWKYLLIPHDEVKEANILGSYISKFQQS
ncbi:DEAD/DEAH box helicase family protein [Klebsiella pneumoniae]|uniref:DEAD/DEAH box helicase n=1 Tax=Enterobacteriaceae TaxID=543 RepID=UPI000516CC94|nr:MULTISPECIES: DEAD/DEAH box helicase family protein [Enterobacteriaceae]HDG7918466.1 DEAD/DEAH box helicase family protein [Klebsiella quasipneumoniae]HDT1329148.1 DEAD/DEAH box helicase family protein [Klebsiella pneumoniae subsp. pneumoniae]AVW78702.1 type III restriction endonuclease subunit R [Klebsiella pneumoniae]EEU3123284.1 DEAD/DEAH box helicase family protein [Escherichia coli]EEW2658097.1 DEAD/DEAH box helicase family protein [Escherichia coli]